LKENSWNQFKSVLKNSVPRYWLDTLGKYRYRHKKSDFEGKKIDLIFKEIYRRNYWRNDESVSGPGSTITTTENIRKELENLFSLFKIHSMIDVPCGDFNWMQKTDLRAIQYLGLDIVDEIIHTNCQKYASQNIKFRSFDLTKDPLPAADLVFCRDCLVHFSFHEINKALINVRKSQSHYLMATSFEVPVVNYDIHTGDWRPLNLEQAPFKFPPPLFKIIDEPAEVITQYNLKKILGLWKIADL